MGKKKVEIGVWSTFGQFELFLIFLDLPFLSDMLPQSLPYNDFIDTVLL